MGVYSDNRILVYVDVDDDGNIVDIEAGRRIIPSKQFNYFFITEDEKILFTPEKFKVAAGELIRKE